ncbi:MAG: adenosine kinase [Candidatus Paracaedibacteraceae bacterium]|nr:adenosine kinase [Candidatus Paracaedibacteraceae bacterium]
MLKKNILPSHLASFIITAFMSWGAFANALQIVAISNLIHDTTSSTTTEFIANEVSTIIENINIGSTTWINGTQAEELNQAIQHTHCKKEYEGPGGSAANTIAGLKALGMEVGIIGALAADILGNEYIASLNAKGIKYRLTPAQNKKRGSGTCTVLITENEAGISERTMLTNLGVSGEIIVSEEDLLWLTTAQCLLVEGYLFRPESTYESICYAAERMKSAGKKVALTLSADFCVSGNRDKMLDFINSYVDIVVGNETEAQLLTDASTPEMAAEILKEKKLKGAVTCGANGAYVFDETGVYFIDSPEVSAERVKDTTGAGDQFLAGFLYELFNDGSIQNAGKTGAFCAGDVIKQWGGQPHNSFIDESLFIPYDAIKPEVAESIELKA